MKKDIPPYFKEKFFTQDVSDFSKYKYLKIIHDEEFIKGPGSGDQKFQLAQYIKLAYKLKLKLELPQRLLAPQHQTVGELKGQWTPMHWPDFIDFNKSSIFEDSLSNFFVEKIPQQEDSNILYVKNLTYGDRKLMSEWAQYISELIPTLPKQKGQGLFWSRSEKIINLANQITSKYPNDFNAVIQIRRGDKLYPNDRTFMHIGGPAMYDKLTQPENILLKIKQHEWFNPEKNQPIYVMTDMLEGDPVIEGLNKSEYNFKYCYDFPELMDLKLKNNYLLYDVEIYLKEMAKYSIFRNFWFEGHRINS